MLSRGFCLPICLACLACLANGMLVANFSRAGSWPYAPVGQARSGPVGPRYRSIGPRGPRARTGRTGPAVNWPSASERRDIPDITVLIVAAGTVPFTQPLPAFAPGPARARSVRVVPAAQGRHRGGTAARTMITEDPQPISCRSSMKSEILRDRVARRTRGAAPCVRVPRARPRMALTVTTHHSRQRQWVAR